MSSDVVLTAALRSNLLSLQNTQSLIDETQLKLATGLKVNSALDNPQSFFASESLKNRASDLSSLLDGIGQGIQTIQTADEGIQSLTSLVDQAESLADSARTELGSGGSEATITGSTAFDLDTNFTTYANVDTADEITFTVLDEDGQVITIDAASDDADASALGGIDISTNETVGEVIAQINGIKEDSTGEQLLEASLTSEGYLEIKSLTGGKFRIEFSNNGTANADLANALGFSGTNDHELEGVDNAFTENQYGFTVTGSPVIESYSLFKDTAGNIADRSTALTDLRFEDPNASNALTSLIANADTGDSISIGINGETLAGTANEIVDDAATATVQDIIDGINNNSNLNTSIEASFNESTGAIEIRALSDSVESFQLHANGEAGTDAFTITDGLGFGVGEDIAATDDGDADRSSRSFLFGAGAGKLAQIETDYDTVRTQIDQLVSDASYRGINLLNGDDLTVFFNEDRSNSVTVEGADLTTGSAGLDISAANFGSLENIEAALTEVRAAQDTVRNFSSSLATSLNVLQTREDFTSNLINSLQEGSDRLVVADQNEEGANLLALQTRQTLGVTSLSLASQSQQAVLRLF